MKYNYTDANFKLVMYKDQVKVNIPRFFYKKYGSQLGSSVLFNSKQGHLFSVEIHVEEKNGKKTAYFADGIKYFREHYGYFGTCLTEFHLIRKNEFDAITHPLSPSTQATSSRGIPHVLRLTENLYQHDKVVHWEKKMTRSLVSCGQALAIPAKVRRDEFHKLPREITVVLPDDSHSKWGILWYDHQIKFGSGWYEFCKGYNLEARNILLFEKIKGEDVVYVSLQSN